MRMLADFSHGTEDMRAAWIHNTLLPCLPRRREARRDTDRTSQSASVVRFYQGWNSRQPDFLHSSMAECFCPYLHRHTDTRSAAPALTEQLYLAVYHVLQLNGRN